MAAATIGIRRRSENALWVAMETVRTTRQYLCSHHILSHRGDITAPHHSCVAAIALCLMTSHTKPSVHTCNIPEHVWLILKVNELLAHSDPYKLVRGIIDMNEYGPEVADFVDLVVRDLVSLERVEGVFRKWFGDGLPSDEIVMDVKIGLGIIRRDWIQWQIES